MPGRGVIRLRGSNRRQDVNRCRAGAGRGPRGEANRAHHKRSVIVIDGRSGARSVFRMCDFVMANFKLVFWSRLPGSQIRNSFDNRPLGTVSAGLNPPKGRGIMKPARQGRRNRPQIVRILPANDQTDTATQTQPISQFTTGCDTLLGLLSASPPPSRRGCMRGQMTTEVQSHSLPTILPSSACARGYYSF